MSTDRALLEAAAKAAGLVNPRYHEATGKEYDCGTCILHDTRGGRETHGWNPLTEDADAFRLAVKLGFRIEHAREYAVCYSGSCMADQFTERWSADPFAATRRAIVRAAASMAEASTEAPESSDLPTPDVREKEKQG